MIEDDDWLGWLMMVIDDDGDDDDDWWWWWLITNIRMIIDYGWWCCLMIKIKTKMAKQLHMNIEYRDVDNKHNTWDGKTDKEKDGESDKDKKYWTSVYNRCASLIYTLWL